MFMNADGALTARMRQQGSKGLIGGLLVIAQERSCVDAYRQTLCAPLIIHLSLAKQLTRRMLHELRFDVLVSLLGCGY